MRAKVSVRTRIQLESLEEAEFLYESLSPEVNDHQFFRSSITLELDGTSLVVHVNSHDITAAKANISSMLRWISLLTELIQIIPKKIVNTKNKST